MHNEEGEFMPGSRSDELYTLWSGDLETLLRCKYNVFWSRMIFDESISRFLDSFLRHFLRPALWDDAFPQQNALARSVYERVFKVIINSMQSRTQIVKVINTSSK